MPLELICSVSSQDAAKAAVRAGADALMLRSCECGQFKESLDADALCEVIRYCRVRGRKAYVAFSACASDGELLRLKNIITLASRHGADAFAVQDIGLMRVIKKLAPQVPVMGGAGMSAHSLADVMAAKSMGLSRIALSKELSLEQIKSICAKAELQTMVFAHGATCTSYDGKCYMSSALSSRSAVRGECTYPCRALYAYFGDSPDAHLNLKDTCLVSRLTDIERVGVTSVYIDGTQKKPEYSALICEMYRKALDEGKAPSRAELMKIESIFSREGFTDAYIKGEKGAAMFGMHNESNDREAKKTIAAARKTYLTDPEKPCLPIEMRFCARANEKMTLFCRDGDGNEYTASAPAAPFVKKGTTEAEVRACLEKSERTVFYPEKCEILLDPELKITPAAISAMRRAAFEGIINRRKTVPQRERGEWQPGVKRLPTRRRPAYAFSFLKTDQITPDILNFEPEVVYLPLWRICEDTKIIEILKKRNITLCAVLDRVIFDREWREVLEALRTLKTNGLTDVLCQSVGQIALLKPLGFNLRSDFTLNITNSQSLKELKGMELASVALSFEMSLESIKELSLGVETELVVYGRLPLMITENCLIHKRNSVHTCHNGTMAIIDRTGRSYPLLPEKGCRTSLYNAEKLWLSDKMDDFEKSGASLLRFCFTTENCKECVQTVRAYMEKSTRPPERPTRGLYYHAAY